MSRAGTVVLDLAERSGLLGLLHGAGAGTAILMLHRFREPGIEHAGYDPGALRVLLEHLRRRRYRILPLAELVERMMAGEAAPSRSVVFTVDDGYHDFATTGMDVFAAFDCPVTVFVTTGFLDGHAWMWWDQVELIMRHGPGPASDAEIHAEVERLKRISEADKRAAIQRLAERREVAVPAAAPGRYAPMSWDDVRRAEQRGASFGPHTLTHPILSRTSDDQAADEIAGSWRRLCAEVRRPVPVFCYPNGDAPSFGQRELQLIRAAGLPAAVTTTPGYVRRIDADRDDALRLPRFAMPGTRTGLAQIVTGFEKVKTMLRGRA